jgi:hypothetical protein
VSLCFDVSFKVISEDAPPSTFSSFHTFGDAGGAPHNPKGVDAAAALFILLAASRLTAKVTSPERQDSR